MSYVSRVLQPGEYVGCVLQPGEQVEYATKPHWIVYLPGLLLLVINIPIAATGHVLSRYSEIVTSENAGTFALFSFLSALIVLASAWLNRWTTEIAVTNRRVIYKTGFVRRRTMEMNREKVESVDISQSVLGRLLNFGTVTIRGTGSGIEPLSQIANPIEFRRYITAG